MKLPARNTLVQHLKWFNPIHRPCTPQCTTLQTDRRTDGQTYGHRPTVWPANNYCHNCQGQQHLTEATQRRQRPPKEQVLQSCELLTLSSNSGSY